MKVRHLTLGFLFLLLAAAATGAEGEYTTIAVGDKTLAVEVADTPEKRQSGLMGRGSLAADRGMLFIFEKEKKVSFWMKNTGIPLSIAYISSAGYIREIHELEPYSLEIIRASSPVLYALEVNRNYFKEHGIRVGDMVRFP